MKFSTFVIAKDRHNITPYICICFDVPVRRLEYTYVFDPDVEISDVLACLGVLFELLDALFQQGGQVGVFAALGEVLLGPNDVLVPQLKRVRTVVGAKLHLVFPEGRGRGKPHQ